MDKAQADSLVEAAYHIVLRRTPESPAAEIASTNLQTGRGDVRSLFDGLLGSREFAASQHEFIKAYVHPDLRRLFLDHTQNGEFKLIVKFLMKHGEGTKTIVDVGARGRERSNSYDLLKDFGWKGLLIEANPSLIPIIRAEFGNLDYVLKHCAISNYEGTANFFFGINDDVSSLSETAASGWGMTKGKINVPVRRLPGVIRDNSIESVDILSLDIEGEDIKVLNDLIENSDVRPRLIIIEASKPDMKNLLELPFATCVHAEYALSSICGPNLLLVKK